jgi:carbon-monoxide dehydrogenase medium subunit
MYPAGFNYERAESVSHAVEMLEKHAGEDIQILAGGHSLIPMMKTGLATPKTVVDISGIDDIRGIGDKGDRFTIGALTPYADVAELDAIRERAPVLAEAAAEIGDRQVRNRGTVGGNIAHADPASDLPGVFLALGGSAHVQGPDETRTVDAEEFFHGMYMTDVDEYEVLTGIEVPVHDDGVVSAYAKNPSPASGYAIVGVAAVLETDDGQVTDSVVTANGAMDRPVHLSAVEEALKGRSAEGAPETADRAGESLETSMLLEDEDASPEYREQLLGVYAKKAISRALDLD